MSSKTWNGNFAHNLRLIKGQFFVENYGLYYCVTQNLLFGCLEFVSFLFASRIKKRTFLNDYFRKPKNPCSLRSVQISVSVGKYPKVDFLNILLRDRLCDQLIYILLLMIISLASENGQIPCRELSETFFWISVAHKAQRVKNRP